METDYAERHRAACERLEEAHKAHLRQQTARSHAKWTKAIEDKDEAWRQTKLKPLQREKERIVAQMASLAARLDAIIREELAQHKTDTPSRLCAARGEQRAKRRGAVPQWLTKAQRHEIRDIYREARAKRHHVDHIVPLINKNVCGLHVPWNLQVLSPTENMRKSNRHA